MKTPTLLILAAGMGSRYGGLKQLDQLGPNNETIMDFSVDDAIFAGFKKIVFVIRKEMKQAFDEQILVKYKDKIEVSTVYQELDLLPPGFTVNPERTKPYGTAHAILAAKNAIYEPFAVINADDFYGRDAFVTMAKFLQTEIENNQSLFAMIGYELRNTLSEHGTVSRGVCAKNAQDELISIIEMTKISACDGIIKNKAEDGTETVLTGFEPVSMNFWGFTPLFFESLDILFYQFLERENANPASEFPIPAVIDHFVKSKKAKVKILSSTAVWFGITYQGDKEYVKDKQRV